MEYGKNISWVLISHNHPDGVPIPSKIDFFTFIQTKTEVALICSPVNQSIFINSKINEDYKKRNKIINLYSNIIGSLFLEANDYFKEEIVEIQKSNDNENINKKIKSFQRKYFFKNQSKIIKRINKIFENKNCNINIYML